ncbi:MAG: outer membrane beta-barrel protein [Muribaculaceae bacterium]|nr:outer membrane beta-barrel protein [Muribaculaceae bacterium]
MNKICLLLLAATSTFSCFAQDKGMENANNKPYLGLRLSIDASIPTDLKTTEGSLSTSSNIFGTGGGVALGAVYNIPIVANLFVEPGVDFYYHTNSINMGNYFQESDVFNTDFQNRSLRKFGMRIPVEIGYRYDFDSSISASIFTGPVLNIGFSNDYCVTTTELEGVKYHDSGSMYYSPLYQMQRANFSWRFGVGVNFLKNYYVALSGDVGMLNMIKNNSEHLKKSMHENGFQLTLGYNFK